MLLAYLMFSFLDSSAKWLVVAGIAVVQVSFIRYAGHFLITILLISRGGFTFARFGTQSITLVILRALLLLGSTLLNFIALKYLPLTLTSTIMFLSPIIICALSGPLLGEKVGIWRWSAILVGFLGILIAVRPFEASFHWAVILSLFNVVCLSLYSILTRRLSGRIATTTLQLYTGIVGTVTLFPFALMQWQNPGTTIDWLILLILGFFGWAGHEFLTRAHGFAGASTLTPYSYVFIIYMTILSYLVFEQTPDRWTLSGAAIVISAGLVIWLRERRSSITRISS